MFRRRSWRRRAARANHPLFARFGIVLRSQPKPTTRDRIRQYFRALRPGARPLVGLRRAWRRDEAAEQLQFAFMGEAANNIVRIATPKNEPYLNYGVVDGLGGLGRGVDLAALEFERRGVYVLGQLIQLSEGELQQLRFVRPAAAALIRARLHKMGLAFGMRLFGRNSQFIQSLPAPSLGS